ncbi:hypothetical protein I302_108455 [Kwoniella bestiolae CBS 10118]|uniref:Protein PBN1 n=1 Tax=Kwoniella bestiolae CBS 10118 TaxID=1296100 RepID=A0A1B9FVM7_9TREE|nr:hypothetical protein I302_07171 [Kwoniella bestiolae CBS 10118]OCF22826.1 hypothetical protein I302_07171 [Kwoniella bestiolae CBS 10118]
MSLPPLDLTLSQSSPSFHPTVTLHLNPPSSSLIPPTCNLKAHVSIILPDELFLDPDELADKFAGSAISSYTLSQTGEQGKGKGRVKVDIERPSFNYIQDEEGWIVLDILVDVPNQRPIGRIEEVGVQKEVKVEIPLHGRYLVPFEHGERAVLFPREIRGGWICNTNTLSESQLPVIRSSPVQITLPTGRHSHQPFVEVVTPLVIWLGWGWLVYKIFRLRSRVAQRKSTSSVDVSEKKDI